MQVGSGPSSSSSSSSSTFPHPCLYYESHLRSSPSPEQATRSNLHESPPVHRPPHTPHAAVPSIILSPAPASPVPIAPIDRHTAPSSTLTRDRTPVPIPPYSSFNSRPSLSLSLPDNSPPAYFTPSPPKYSPLAASEETALLLGPGLAARSCQRCHIEGLGGDVPCRCSDKPSDWVVSLMICLNLMIWGAVIWAYFITWRDPNWPGYHCGSPVAGPGGGIVYHPGCMDEPIGGRFESDAR